MNSRKRLLKSSSPSSNCDDPEENDFGGIKTPHQKPTDRPVHTAQDSLFSTSSGWTDYRGFVNLALLLLVVSNGRVALENLIKYGILINPIQWVSFVVVDPWSWPNCTIVALSNLFIGVVFVVEKMLESSSLSNRFSAVFYPAFFLLQLVFPVVIILLRNGNPVFASISLCIYVIECLKLISYVHVNYWCRSARRLQQNHKERTHTLSEKLYSYPRNLTLGNLYYFLLAPTLCYELNFPRTAKIRIDFVMKRLFEVIGLTLLIMALCEQWVVPLLKNSVEPFSEMDLSRCAERLLKLAIPNMIIWLLFFYSIFHSALNLVAELLQFADRQFYRFDARFSAIMHCVQGFLELGDCDVLLANLECSCSSLGPSTCL